MKTPAKVEKVHFGQIGPPPNPSVPRCAKLARLTQLFQLNFWNLCSGFCLNLEEMLSNMIFTSQINSPCKASKDSA